jgi:hypothetical protein
VPRDRCEGGGGRHCGAAAKQQVSGLE